MLCAGIARYEEGWRLATFLWTNDAGADAVTCKLHRTAPGDCTSLWIGFEDVTCTLAKNIRRVNGRFKLCY